VDRQAAAAFATKVFSLFKQRDLPPGMQYHSRGAQDTEAAAGCPVVSCREQQRPRATDDG
jgi:hypothetical protein